MTIMMNTFFLLYVRKMWAVEIDNHAHKTH